MKKILIVVMFFALINGVSAKDEGLISVKKSATKVSDRQFKVSFDISANSFNEKVEVINYKNVDIALLVDTSLSMGDETTLNKKTVTKLEAAKTSMISLVNELLKVENIRISLTEFYKEGSIVQKLTNDKDTLISKINSLELKESTNMQDGINEAYKTFEDNNNKKIIIILSDGEPNYIKSTLGTIYYINPNINYKYESNDISYNCSTNCTATQFTISAANFFKENNIEFYAIGFTTNNKANELLKNIAGDNFKSALSGTELLDKFKKISEEIKTINDVGNNAYLTDIIPNTFILKEEEINKLKDTYGDNISIKDNIINLNIGDITAEEDIKFEYILESPIYYHGSLYTNRSATLKFIPKEKNPYEYTIDNYGYTTIDIPNPNVLIEAVSLDDVINNIKCNSSIDISSNKLLSNDSNSYFFEGIYKDNVEEVLDEIEIVDYPKNGSLEKTTDGFKYTPSSCVDSDSFTYKIKTTIGDTILYSNISTVHLGINKIYGSVVINYLDKDGNKLKESDELVGEYGEDYSIDPVDIDGYKLLSKYDILDGKFTDEEIKIDFLYEKENTIKPVNTGINDNNIYGVVAIISFIILFIFRKIKI